MPTRMTLNMPETWQILFLSLVLCSVKASPPSCDPTSQHPTTQLYALNLSSTEYSTVQSTSITIKLFMTVCPGIDTRGPTWYKLEALSDETKKLEGTFGAPPLRSEAILTDNNASLEFTTSEPVAISDLPRIYKWSRQNGNVGEICFRLTILGNDSESNGCRQTQKCVSPSVVPTESDSMSGNDGQKNLTNSNNQTNSHSYKPTTESENDAMSSAAGINLITPKDLVEEDSNLVVPLTRKEKCNMMINCTNARLRDFCVNDGNTYPSRCAIRLQKCVERVDLEIVSRGPCVVVTSTPPPEPTPCWDEQNKYNGFLWTPKCTHRGGYKPIQCISNYSSGKVECWCSTKHGHEFGEKEDHKCTDPESFNQFNHCLWLLENR